MRHHSANGWRGRGKSYYVCTNQWFSEKYGTSAKYDNNGNRLGDHHYTIIAGEEDYPLLLAKDGPTMTILNPEEGQKLWDKLLKPRGGSRNAHSV